jgi:hypothetical protein
MNRKILLLLLLLTGSLAKAQDTTALRFAGFSDGAELVLFDDDSTNLYYTNFDPIGSFNALFHHPFTSELYCLFDSVQGDGFRKFYQIDPFSGQKTLVYDPSADYLASACWGPNGKVYAITGHGNSSPGMVYEVDMFNGWDSLLTTVPYGSGSGVSITYVEQVDELWMFDPAADSLIRLNLTNLTFTKAPCNLAADGTIKATYLDPVTQQFFLASDNPFTLDVANPTGVTLGSFTLPDYLNDVEKLDMVREGDTLEICDGDSLTLNARFGHDNFHWYKDGSLIASGSGSLSVNQSGIYRLLAEMTNDSLYIWSEEVMVIVNQVPAPQFTYTPSLPMATLPISFSDTGSVGTYFWDFGDGSTDTTANPSHSYANAGTYIVTLTVTNGICQGTFSDTVVVSPFVGMDPAQVSGFEVGVYPNPVDAQLGVRLNLTQALVLDIAVTDLVGRTVGTVWQGNLSAGSHTFRWDGAASLAPGIYLLQVKTSEAQVTQRVMVAH